MSDKYDILTNKEKIFEIARNDPSVYHLLQMVQLKEITFEQAMMSGVSILSEQNAELRKLCSSLVATSVHIITPSTLHEIGHGLSPAQKKDVEQIINRAIKAAGSIP